MTSGFLNSRATACRNARLSSTARVRSDTACLKAGNRTITVGEVLLRADTKQLIFVQQHKLLPDGEHPPPRTPVSTQSLDPRRSPLPQGSDYVPTTVARLTGALARLDTAGVAQHFGISASKLAEWNANIPMNASAQFKSGTHLTVPVLHGTQRTTPPSPSGGHLRPERRSRRTPPPTRLAKPGSGQRTSYCPHPCCKSSSISSIRSHRSCTVQRSLPGESAAGCAWAPLQPRANRPCHGWAS
jgi:hypothetical protein